MQLNQEIWYFIRPSLSSDDFHLPVKGKFLKERAGHVRYQTEEGTQVTARFDGAREEYGGVCYSLPYITYEDALHEMKQAMYDVGTDLAKRLDQISDRMDELWPEDVPPEEV